MEEILNSIICNLPLMSPFATAIAYLAIAMIALYKCGRFAVTRLSGSHLPIRREAQEIASLLETDTWEKDGRHWLKNKTPDGYLLSVNTDGDVYGAKKGQSFHISKYWNRRERRLIKRTTRELLLAKERLQEQEQQDQGHSILGRFVGGPYECDDR